MGTDQNAFIRDIRVILLLRGIALQLLRGGVPLEKRSLVQLKIGAGIRREFADLHDSGRISG